MKLQKSSNTDLPKLTTKQKKWKRIYDISQKAKLFVQWNNKPRQ